MTRIRTLIIDNYDSFTFNLFQLFAGVNGCEPVVVRHDALRARDVEGLACDNIVISPGPGRPERRADFGICAQVMAEARVPVLGVCLGCQGLAHVFGGRVVHARVPMHGRLSRVFHGRDPLFAGIPQGFQAVRYHSLVVGSRLPAVLRRIAWTEDGVPMAIRHAERPLWGVQFHPESICTAHGRRLAENFRRVTEMWQRAQAVSPERPRPPTGRTGKRMTSLPSGGRASPRAVPRSGFRRPLQVLWEKLPGWKDPESLFCGLFGGAAQAFWLDSSLVKAGLSRFSFMGTPAGLRLYDAAGHRIGVKPDDGGRGRGRKGGLFEDLDRMTQAPLDGGESLPFGFRGGAVGYLGYELKRACGFPARHRSPYPDAALFAVDCFLAFDHARREVYCVWTGRDAAQGRRWLKEMEARCRAVSDAAPARMEARPVRIPARMSRGRSGYLKDVQQCRRWIRDGESYELCLTENLHCEVDVDPLAYYRVLRQVNPAPYAAYLKLGGMAVVCSSPERFLAVDRRGRVESKPIKGTQRRGGTAAEDRALRRDLAAGEKNRAENLMIVDLLRNDLGRVCRPGSVTVPALMRVESYATVHQLVSTVAGRLREGCGISEVLRAAFPGGSMTGAPKRRTLELLDRLEREARGVYSGALGWISPGGAADLNIVIRTAVVTPGRVRIGTGGAVVALSDSGDEFREIQLKARALLDALARTPGVRPLKRRGTERQTNRA